MSNSIPPDRAIPGTMTVEGRRIIYLEALPDLSFDVLWERFGVFLEDKVKSGDGPKSGGIISENDMLRTPTQKAYFGLSFRGDLEQWSAIFKAFADIMKLRTARIEGVSFLIDGGEVYALSDCCRIDLESG